MRRAFETWSALVHLKFSQDTTDAAAKAAREYADGLAPEAADLETSFKRRLLALPDRAALAGAAGAHAVRLWETDVTAFDPAIKPDLEEESRLTARYTEILASAALSIGGKTVNLAGIAPFAEDPDRAVRHEAETLRWSFFAQHGAELDQIYADLVRLRHGMARKLGFPDYTPLGLSPDAPGGLRTRRRGALSRAGGDPCRALGRPSAGAAAGRIWLGPAAFLG